MKPTDLRARAAELEEEISRVRAMTPVEDRSEVTIIRRLMEDAPCGFVFFNTDFRYEVVNAKLAEMHGIPASVHIGRTVEEIVPHLADRARHAFQQVLATGEPLLDIEFQGKTAAVPGVMRHWSESWYPMHGADGRLLGVGAVVTDITESKRALESLQLQQQRLELAQAVGGIGSWEWDLITQEVHCSPGYGPLYGLPSNRRGPDYEQWLKLVHPADRERLQEEVRRVLEGLTEYKSEFRVVWPDGTVRWLSGTGRVFRDPSGNPTRVLGVNMDITERKKAEQALIDSEARFRQMADTAPVMICASGQNQGATFFNQGWLSFTGRRMDQELGHGWAEGVHPEDRDRVLAAIAASSEARSFCHLEYRLRRADGEYGWVLCNGVPRFEPDGTFTGYIATCTDITDLRRAHIEALARQRLETVGVLAGGIAHDFNNLLASILADSELLEAELGDESPAREGIERIKRVAERAAGIVRELLAYAGKEDAVFEPVDLSSLVREMLQLLKVSISKRVTLKIDLPGDLPAVRANASQLRQVVLNLVTNASEAIGEGSGTITVAAARAEDDFVCLEIRDTGCGMSPEVLAKIFEPFFTTKFTGRGMGLAAVQGIIDRHGGVIHVESTAGQGTRFEVLLPGMGKPAETLAAAESPSEPPAEHSQGGILLVEDEAGLRTPVGMMLRRKGYSVFEADDGIAALELFRSKAQEIDVVLLDMTLPGMSGPQILTELRRIQPQVNVILTTAYSQEKVLSELGGEESSAFIRKPYQLGDLMKLLQRVSPRRDPPPPAQKNAES